MQLVIPPLFVFWKLLKRTKLVLPHEADLVWERPIIDAYEETFLGPPVGFWREIGQIIGFRKAKIDGGNDARRPSILPPDTGMGMQDEKTYGHVSS